MTASNGGAPCLRAGDVAVPIVVIELEGIAGPSAFWSRDRSRRLSQNLIADCQQRCTPKIWRPRLLGGLWAIESLPPPPGRILSPWRVA